MHTVLVVDDDRLVTAFMATWLKVLGCVPICVSNVADAFKILEAMDVDAVLLDLVFPEGSGFDVIHHLKSAERTLSIPVIVVSIKDDPEVITKVIVSGADLFLAKPTDFNQIKRVLGLVLPVLPAGETHQANISLPEDSRRAEAIEAHKIANGRWVL